MLALPQRLVSGVLRVLRRAGAKDKAKELAPASPADAASGLKDALPDGAADAAGAAAKAADSNPFSGFFGGASHSCADG